MVFRRGGVLAGRLRRGSGRGVHLAGLRVRVPIQLFGRGRACILVLPVVVRIAYRRQMSDVATSATVVHGVTRAQASDTRSFPAGCASRTLPGPARQVGKSPARHVEA